MKACCRVLTENQLNWFRSCSNPVFQEFCSLYLTISTIFHGIYPEEVEFKMVIEEELTKRLA